MAWLQAREDFNKTFNAQAAQKAMTDMVTVTGREAQVDLRSILRKAKQFLEMCAAQEALALEWLQNNGCGLRHLPCHDLRCFETI